MSQWYRLVRVMVGLGVVIGGVLATAHTHAQPATPPCDEAALVYDTVTTTLLLMCDPAYPPQVLTEVPPNFLDTHWPYTLDHRTIYWIQGDMVRYHMALPDGTMHEWPIEVSYGSLVGTQVDQSATFFIDAHESDTTDTPNVTLNRLNHADMEYTPLMGDTFEFGYERQQGQSALIYDTRPDEDGRRWYALDLATGNLTAFGSLPGEYIREYWSDRWLVISDRQHGHLPTAFTRFDLATGAWTTVHLPVDVVAARVGDDGSLWIETPEHQRWVIEWLTQSQTLVGQMPAVELPYRVLGTVDEQTYLLGIEVQRSRDSADIDELALLDLTTGLIERLGVQVEYGRDLPRWLPLVGRYLYSTVSNDGTAYLVSFDPRTRQSTRLGVHDPFAYGFALSPSGRAYVYTYPPFRWGSTVVAAETAVDENLRFLMWVQLAP